MDNVKHEERPVDITQKLYWDDLTVGQKFSFGEYFLSEQEIIEFAIRYDPMAFHTDPIKAQQSPIGVLCASGIQSIAILQRLAVDNVYKKWHIVAGKSLDTCRFKRPVVSNDILSATMTIVALDKSSNKERGLVSMAFSLINASNQIVLTQSGTMVVSRR